MAAPRPFLDQLTVPLGLAQDQCCSSWIGRPLPTVRIHYRVFASLSRLRIMMFAMDTPSIRPRVQSTRRLRCNQGIAIDHTGCRRRHTSCLATRFQRLPRTHCRWPCDQQCDCYPMVSASQSPAVIHTGRPARLVGKQRRDHRPLSSSVRSKRPIAILPSSVAHLQSR